MIPTAHPRILRSQIRTASRFFTVESVQLQFSNGSVREFERIVAQPQPGAVVLVAVTGNHDVLLVREFAAGVGRYEWSLPSGGLQSGESIHQSAARELMEETGYCARRFETIGRLALAPSILGYESHIVLAVDLYPCAARGDEPEALQVIAWPIDRIRELVAQQGVCDARALAALYLARDHLTS